MTILFFSATGNSLAVAKEFGGTLKSIPQLIRDKEYTIKDDVIGIIAPVYFLGLPRLVRQYLEKANLNADYIFGILTYGSLCGASIHQLKKVLELNGNSLDYGNNLEMVDNYLPGFKIEDEIAKIPEKQIDMHIAEIKKDVEERKQAMPDKKLFSSAITTIFSKTIMTPKRLDSTDKKYTVTDKCIQCDTCAKVCPVSNITVEDKPIFKQHCESCFACIHNCPVNAIQVKGQKSEMQFRNSAVSVKELIVANDQG